MQNLTLSLKAHPLSGIFLDSAATRIRLWNSESVSAEGGEEDTWAFA